MTGLITKKYGFMPRVIILCHFKKKLDFYIYIYIYIYMIFLFKIFRMIHDWWAEDEINYTGVNSCTF
jgi:hypothetical protein